MTESEGENGLNTYPTYYAKSADETGQQETNQQHLSQVAELALQFGKEISLPVTAWLCGMFHDFGKYSALFQKVLDGTAGGIDHAICGAVYLYATKAQGREAYRLAVAVIAAHHSTLRSYESLLPEMGSILKGQGCGICATGKRAALFGIQEYQEAIGAFCRDFPTFSFRKLESGEKGTPLESMLRTRMLFSCLVDADYTVSSQKEFRGETSLHAGQLLQTLNTYMDRLRAGSQADGELNRIRDRVFERCGEAGEQKPGIFTLTAPTGVGKTLSLLHFALRHCIANQGLRRIIVVLPFLTLTEQSQREYEKLIPHILTDHSQSRLSEEDRELVARWDAPFIITTSVRFFEGLFSCQPKDCRKLHQIAQSVILFDEAQSLPTDLMTATVQTAAALCKDYGSTVVLSTATQPDFGALPEVQRWQPREILPEGKRYYRALKRVNVDWKLNEPTPLKSIAAEMRRQDSTCALVNLRRHAAELFQELKQHAPAEELFFLTTELCPAHRSAVISEIRARQKQGLCCRVVATQCIEAGVDLDFHTMYRALAPLEAIIQAAGRCNRNGRATDGGWLKVFIPEDERRIYPGDSYQKGAEIVKIMWAAGCLDIHDPDVIADYYRRLFHGARDREALTRAIFSEDYEAVRQEYRLIRRQGVQVIVPYDPELFHQIKLQAQRDGLTPALIKQAAPITVSTYEAASVRKHCEPVLWHRGRQDGNVESDFFLLLAGHEGCYQSDMGLRLDSFNTDGEPFIF